MSGYFTESAYFAVDLIGYFIIQEKTQDWMVSQVS